MVKFKRSISKALAGALIFSVCISTFFAAPAARAAEASEKESRADSYGITIEGVSENVYFSDTEDSVHISEVIVSCPDEWKDKIRYQWRREVMTGDGDISMVDVEGETDRTFRPSLAVLQETRWFICRITIEGDNEFYLDSDYVYYRKLNDIVDLTEKAYDDTIRTDDLDGTFTRKIQGGADTKSLHIHWKPVDGVYGVTFLDAKGRAFFNHDEDNLEEMDLELEGNFCYIEVYYDRLPEKLGITAVEELDTFTRKPVRFLVDTIAGPDIFSVGEHLDKTKIYASFFYNDGTYEDISVDSLSWDTEQTFGYGQNRFVIKEKNTGMSAVLSIYLRYSPEWKEKPAASFNAGDIQRASVDFSAVGGEGAVHCLWMLKNMRGELAAEIEDDTETEVVLPQDLLPGRYQLCCYYYTKEEGFQEYNYIRTEFRVLASGQTPSPSPSAKPSGTQPPSATPLPNNNQKKPGTVAVSVKGKKSAASVKIKKKANADGFQIVYAKNKALTKGKHSVYTKKTSYNIKIAKKKKKQKIYVRARAYCKAGKKKRYGKWSRTVSCKI